MKTFAFAIAAVVAAVALQAEPQLGDTYEKVIAEKGRPAGVVEAGGTKIVRFKDQTIKFKEGRVVALDAVPVTVIPAPAVAVRPPAKRPAASAVWMTDFAAARDQAKAQGRHVFLFFTGSDWCGWCQRLNQEILSTPEFAQYAGEHLILVELDFPRGKPQSQALVAQNARLQQQYRIRGYPTVIVLDSSGRAVGHLGYQEGGPGPFLEALSRM